MAPSDTPYRPFGDGNEGGNEVRHDVDPITKTTRAVYAFYYASLLVNYFQTSETRLYCEVFNVFAGGMVFFWCISSERLTLRQARVIPAFFQWVTQIGIGRLAKISYTALVVINAYQLSIGIREMDSRELAVAQFCISILRLPTLVLLNNKFDVGEVLASEANEQEQSLSNTKNILKGFSFLCTGFHVLITAKQQKHAPSVEVWVFEAIRTITLLQAVQARYFDRRKRFVVPRDTFYDQQPAGVFSGLRWVPLCNFFISLLFVVSIVTELNLQIKNPQKCTLSMPGPIAINASLFCVSTMGFFSQSSQANASKRWSSKIRKFLNIPLEIAASFCLSCVNLALEITMHWHSCSGYGIGQAVSRWLGLNVMLVNTAHFPWQNERVLAFLNRALVVILTTVLVPTNLVGNALDYKLALDQNHSTTTFISHINPYNFSVMDVSAVVPAPEDDTNMWLLQPSMYERLHMKVERRRSFNKSSSLHRDTFEEMGGETGVAADGDHSIGGGSWWDSCKHWENFDDTTHYTSAEERSQKFQVENDPARRLLGSSNSTPPNHPTVEAYEKASYQLFLYSMILSVCLTFIDRIASKIFGTLISEEEYDKKLKRQRERREKATATQENNNQYRPDGPGANFEPTHAPDKTDNTNNSVGNQLEVEISELPSESSYDEHGGRPRERVIRTEGDNGDDSRNDATVDRSNSLSESIHYNPYATSSRNLEKLQKRQLTLVYLVFLLVSSVIVDYAYLSCDSLTFGDSGSSALSQACRLDKDSPYITAIAFAYLPMTFFSFGVVLSLIKTTRGRTFRNPFIVQRATLMFIPYLILFGSMVVLSIAPNHRLGQWFLDEMPLYLLMQPLHVAFEYAALGFIAVTGQLRFPHSPQYTQGFFLAYLNRLLYIIYMIVQTVFHSQYMVAQEPYPGATIVFLCELVFWYISFLFGFGVADTPQQIAQVLEQEEEMVEYLESRNNAEGIEGWMNRGVAESSEEIHYEEHEELEEQDRNPNGDDGEGGHRTAVSGVSEGGTVWGANRENGRSAAVTEPKRRSLKAAKNAPHLQGKSSNTREVRVRMVYAEPASRAFSLDEPTVPHFASSWPQIGGPFEQHEPQTHEQQQMEQGVLEGTYDSKRQPSHHFSAAQSDVVTPRSRPLWEDLAENCAKKYGESSGVTQELVMLMFRPDCVETFRALRRKRFRIALVFFFMSNILYPIADVWPCTSKVGLMVKFIIIVIDTILLRLCIGGYRSNNIPYLVARYHQVARRSILPFLVFFVSVLEIWMMAGNPPWCPFALDHLLDLTDLLVRVPTCFILLLQLLLPTNCTHSPSTKLSLSSLRSSMKYSHQDDHKSIGSMRGSSRVSETTSALVAEPSNIVKQLASEFPGDNWKVPVESQQKRTTESFSSTGAGIQLTPQTSNIDLTDQTGANTEGKGPRTESGQERHDRSEWTLVDADGHTFFPDGPDKWVFLDYDRAKIIRSLILVNIVVSAGFLANAMVLGSKYGCIGPHIVRMSILSRIGRFWIVGEIFRIATAVCPIIPKLE